MGVLGCTDTQSARTISEASSEAVNKTIEKEPPKLLEGSELGEKVLQCICQKKIKSEKLFQVESA